MSLLSALFLAGAASGLLVSAQPLHSDHVHLLGSAARFETRIRLTPAQPQTVGAAWAPLKQRILDGFDTAFSFQITQTGGKDNGSDGFAFVLQNHGPHAIAGRGSAGGFALGDGNRNWSKPGIASSLAIFFDTHRNGRSEPSSNYVALCSNGTPAQMKWPPQRLGYSRKLPVSLKDGRAHQVRVQFRPPLLTVSLDSIPVLQVPVEMRAFADEAGKAWVGFTASTGDGFQNHDVFDWSFHAPDVSSTLTAVDSNITFLLPSSCLPGRNLCTPHHPEVSPQAAGRFHVVLPANLRWGVSIPNPGHRTVSVAITAGAFCFNLNGTPICGSASSPLDFVATSRERLLQPNERPGTLLIKTENGRTHFSLNLPDTSIASSEGRIEFDAVLH